LFITAELGCSWVGDFGTLESLIRWSKTAGCDAVKLQALSPEIIKRHPELTWYKHASVNYENVMQIDDICKHYEIEWYCTPTFPKAVEMLEPYVNKYKIRTLDNNNKKLCDAVFGTGKQVIISSEKPLRYDDKRIKNIYCIPRYPVDFHEYNYNIIKSFDGFSNHSDNPLAIFKAVEMGAEYIEFHLTPTRDLFLLDNKVSFTYLEMIEIIKWIRNHESWNNSTGKSIESKIPE